MTHTIVNPEIKLTPVAAISDPVNVARQFVENLALPENQDIDREFPRTNERLGTTVEVAVEDLSNTADRCKPGQHEVFIGNVGNKVIGLCWITISNQPPQSVNPLSPNISGFVMYPWRRMGYGMHSLTGKLLDIINRGYNSEAWTYINKNNFASEELAKRAGFQLIPEEPSVPEDYNLFVYQSANQ